MKVLITYMSPRDKIQKNNLDYFKKTIKKLNEEFNFKYSFKKRDYLKSFENFDLIITLGGDGTFLRTSRCIEDETPIFGVNLDTRYKEGFLLQSTIENFEIDFKKILNKQFKIKKIDRLIVSINDKIMPIIALNEFYIGNEKSYLMSRYEFIVNGKKEFQKSSGIIVGTGAGSNAWIKSANGKIMPFDSRKFQIIVREPFCSKKTQCTIRNAIYNEKQIFKIKSEMHKGIIVADSLKPEFKFKKNDIIKVMMSEKKLNYIII
jgi:NAD kinase